MDGGNEDLRRGRMHVLSPSTGIWTHVAAAAKVPRRMLMGKCNIKYFLNANKYLAAVR